MFIELFSRGWNFLLMLLVCKFKISGCSKGERFKIPGRALSVLCIILLACSISFHFHLCNSPKVINFMYHYHLNHQLEIIFRHWFVCHWPRLCAIHAQVTTHNWCEGAARNINLQIAKYISVMCLFDFVLYFLGCAISKSVFDSWWENAQQTCNRFGDSFFFAISCYATLTLTKLHLWQSCFAFLKSNYLKPLLLGSAFSNLYNL